MKKLLLSFAAVIASGILFAQSTTSTIVPNFTLTNTNGQPRDLYTELAKGKAIVLDLFYNECGYCQQYAPIVDQAYKAHGSGTGKIDFWGLNSEAQSDASINAYKAQYGVTNQCFGGAAAKQAAQNVFFAFVPGGGNIGFPTYAVVCPNKTGFWDVNYPPTVTGFNTYFTQCGVLGVNNIIRDENQARLVSIYPNPGNNASKVDFFLLERGKVQIAIFDLLGEQVSVIANEIFDGGTHTLDFSAAPLSSGNYLIKMITENGVADIAKITIVN